MEASDVELLLFFTLKKSSSQNIHQFGEMK